MSILKLPNDDWDFSELKQSQRQYGVHFFHHYTAKFIPQIPSKIIKQFTKENDLVVDPFMGSGTTLIEARTLGRKSIGLDTNPLAVNITKAKTLLLDDKKTQEIDNFIYWIQEKRRFSEKINEKIENGNYSLFMQTWFRADVANKIVSILNEIEKYSPEIKNFLQIGLSTLLKGMSNARMDSVTPILPSLPIYIDKKHYFREVNNLTRKIPVYGRVYSQINKMKNALLLSNQSIENSLICNPILGDAKELSKYVNKCDLVVTSPPYWNAQDYAHIHMLSLKLFNISTEEGKEIGRISSHYFDEMKIVFNQIANILDGHFALIIGEDNEKNSHEMLFKIATQIGFKPVDLFSRNISNQVSRAKQIKREFIYILKISEH